MLKRRRKVKRRVQSSTISEESGTAEGASDTTASNADTKTQGATFLTEPPLSVATTTPGSINNTNNTATERKLSTLSNEQQQYNEIRNYYRFINIIKRSKLPVKLLPPPPVSPSRLRELLNQRAANSPTRTMPVDVDIFNLPTPNTSLQSPTTATGDDEFDTGIVWRGALGSRNQSPYTTPGMSTNPSSDHLVGGEDVKIGRVTPSRIQRIPSSFNTPRTGRSRSPSILSPDYLSLQETTKPRRRTVRLTQAMMQTQMMKTSTEDNHTFALFWSTLLRKRDRSYKGNRYIDEAMAPTLQLLSNSQNDDSSETPFTDSVESSVYLEGRGDSDAHREIYGLSSAGGDEKDGDGLKVIADRAFQMESLLDELVRSELNNPKNMNFVGEHKKGHKNLSINTARSSRTTPLPSPGKLDSLRSTLDTLLVSDGHSLADTRNAVVISAPAPFKPATPTGHPGRKARRKPTLLNAMIDVLNAPLEPDEPIEEVPVEPPAKDPNAPISFDYSFNARDSMTSQKLTIVLQELNHIINNTGNTMVLPPVVESAIHPSLSTDSGDVRDHKGLKTSSSKGSAGHNSKAALTSQKTTPTSGSRPGTTSRPGTGGRQQDSKSASRPLTAQQRAVSAARSRTNSGQFGIALSPADAAFVRDDWSDFLSISSNILDSSELEQQLFTPVPGITLEPLVIGMRRSQVNSANLSPTAATAPGNRISSPLSGTPRGGSRLNSSHSQHRSLVVSLPYIQSDAPDDTTRLTPNEDFTAIAEGSIDSVQMMDTEARTQSPPKPAWLRRIIADPYVYKSKPRTLSPETVPSADKRLKIPHTITYGEPVVLQSTEGVTSVTTRPSTTSNKQQEKSDSVLPKVSISFSGAEEAPSERADYLSAVEARQMYSERRAESAARAMRMPEGSHNGDKGVEFKELFFDPNSMSLVITTRYQNNIINVAVLDATPVEHTLHIPLSTVYITQSQVSDMITVRSSANDNSLNKGYNNDSSVLRSISSPAKTTRQSSPQPIVAPHPDLHNALRSTVATPTITTGRSIKQSFETINHTSLFYPNQSPPASRSASPQIIFVSPARKSRYTELISRSAPSTSLS
eukprot:gene24060-30359_t